MFSRPGIPLTHRGKYDESYIDYTISIIRKCRKHGFKVCRSSLADGSEDNKLIVKSSRLIRTCFLDSFQDQEHLIGR
jgi:hypothetical protein